MIEFWLISCLAQGMIGVANLIMDLIAKIMLTSNLSCIQYLGMFS